MNQQPTIRQKNYDHTFGQGTGEAGETTLAFG